MSPELLKKIMSLDRIERSANSSPVAIPSATNPIVDHTNTSTGPNQQSNNNNHVRRRNLPFSGFVFPCIYPNCQQTFRATQTLYNHIRAHDAPQKVCPYCGKKMPSVVQLVGHARTHSKCYPYTCPIWYCKFSSALKPALKRHLQSSVHQLSINLLYHSCAYPFF